MSEQGEEGAQEESFLRNILTIIGFIIIAAIVLWGLFHLVSLAVPGVSSFFSRLFKTGVTVHVPAGEISSGTAVDVSWSHRATEAGDYAFRYACRDGLRMSAPSSEGVPSPIPCGVMYGVQGGVKSIRVVPTLSGAPSVEVPVSVAFIARATATPGTKRPEGTADMTIVATGAPAEETGTPPAQPLSEPAEPAETPKPAATGKPDLRARIVSVGTYDGVFMPNAPISPSQTAAVRFAVTNAGNTASGSWYFTVSLPMNPAQTYTSPAQTPLPAGYTGEYILQFRPVASGGGLFSIFADAGLSVAESDESNNTAVTSVYMPAYTGTYPQYLPNYYAPSMAPYSQPYPYYGY